MNRPSCFVNSIKIPPQAKWLAGGRITPIIKSEEGRGRVTAATSGLDATSREFLEGAIADYNLMFGTKYSTDSEKFQNYYKDLSLRMKMRETAQREAKEISMQPTELDMAAEPK